MDSSGFFIASAFLVEVEKYTPLHCHDQNLSMQCKPFGRSRTFVLKVMWILVDGDQVETGSKDAIVSS